MNKLIIIGNGFDLAHGLKTDYNSFIRWFVLKCFREATFEDENTSKRPKHISNQIFEISATTGKVLSNVTSFSNIGNLVDMFLQGEYTLPHQYQTIRLDNKYFDIKGTVKSTLMKGVLADRREYNWVDIENHFYQRLKDILSKRKPYIGGPKGEFSVKERIDLLNKLNQELDDLTTQLSEYLSEEIRDANVNDAFRVFVEEGINPDAILEKHFLKNEEFVNNGSSIIKYIQPKSIQFLDFNYTSLISKLDVSGTIDYVHIHGILNDDNNPLIFGYGDEIDESYLEMEKTNINEYLTHIKSFGYFRTNNYSRLVNFLSSEPYVVYIWGHSCGLSDRTLLNMIFEHDNCTGIKIFYRKREDGSDNFEELTQNISRHFKNKLKLRNRVFNKTYCELMPQVIQRS